jgi:SAM-dependent methyltransferase
MVYVSRRPSEAELMAYYANYPAVAHLTAVTEKRYNELLDRFEPFRKSGRLIDVGCGSGLFLQVAAERGWEVHGTEYGERPIAACKAKGIHIIEGALDPSNYPPGYFDVVCSFEVIEHLVDPGIELDRFNAILRPGGLLYVTTPNFNCLARRFSPKDWNVVSYPEHLMYFTPSTLVRMAGQHGFKPLWVTTSGISLYRWLTRKRVSDPQVKQQARQSQEEFRESLENRPLLRMAKSTLNGLLHLSGTGDSLKAGFLKPDAQ